MPLDKFISIVNYLYIRVIALQPRGRAVRVLLGGRFFKTVNERITKRVIVRFKGLHHKVKIRPLETGTPRRREGGLLFHLLSVKSENRILWSHLW